VLPEVVPPAHGDRAERIAAATQAVADALAEGIRSHPEDWHMLQRLWLADLDPQRLADRDAQGA
jgi:lauroyl/myristoyl acyltransferase